MSPCPAFRLSVVLCASMVGACSPATPPPDDASSSRVDGSIDARRVDVGSGDPDASSDIDTGAVVRSDAGGDAGGALNAVLGSVLGHSLPSATPMFCPTGGGPVDDVTLIFASRPDVCAVAMTNRYPASSEQLVIHLVQASGPATFPIPGGGAASTGEALASFTASDAACGQTGAMASGGEVTVTAIDNSAAGYIRGTFNILFDGDSMSGRFDTSVCRVQYYCSDGSGGCAP